LFHLNGFLTQKNQNIKNEKKMIASVQNNFLAQKKNQNIKTEKKM